MLNEADTNLAGTCRILEEGNNLHQRKGNWFWACGELTPYEVKFQELHDRMMKVYVYSVFILHGVMIVEHKHMRQKN